MTAKLNMNETPYYSWKGKTFNQITSSIQKNKITIPTTSSNLLFNARPLTIYRKESASMQISSGNPRISISIDEINAPGGYTVSNNESTDCSFGIVNVLNAKDMNITTNKSQNGDCTNENPCMGDAYNARRRLRSGGMIKKNSAATGANYEPYYTSNKQLLASRSKTFDQNQYHYIRKGDSSAKPGVNAASGNTYSAHGTSKCVKYHITSVLGNNTFSYQWFDAANYEVTISDGYYDLDDLNAQFKLAMIANNHYLIIKSTLSYKMLLNIAYNSVSKKIELQSTAYSKYLYSTTDYGFPTTNTWSSYVANLTTSSTAVAPRFIIPSSFQNVIGFTTGSYPSTEITLTEDDLCIQGSDYSYTTDQVSVSSEYAKLLPTYSAVYYKPNNSQFAQQGGVSSSSRITRLKYNTITNNTYNYQTAYGKAIANALAYGVPEGGYTIKDKTGYPTKCTPTFSKYTDEMKKCSATKFSNMI